MNKNKRKLLARLKAVSLTLKRAEKQLTKGNGKYTNLCIKIHAMYQIGVLNREIYGKEIQRVQQD